MCQNTNEWRCGIVTTFEKLDVPVTKASEGFAPCPHDQRLFPWTPLGASPPDPSYRHALHACDVGRPSDMSGMKRLFRNAQRSVIRSPAASQFSVNLLLQKHTKHKQHQSVRKARVANLSLVSSRSAQNFLNA